MVTPKKPKHWSKEELVPLPTLPPPPDSQSSTRSAAAEPVTARRATPTAALGVKESRKVLELIQDQHVMV